MPRRGFVPLFAVFVSFVTGCIVCCMIPSVATESAVHASDGEPEWPIHLAMAEAADVRSATATNSEAMTGDWNQWGGSAARNNVPTATNIPIDWKVGGFDRATGEWKQDKAKHIKWVAAVGSQTYGNPVVAEGQVYVGTNNGRGYLARYPSDIDLGCLLAFSEKDGRFLWQHSSEKLLTGRVHDWPLQGICCAPLVEGDRLWYVSSRGEVVCLDTQGFHDNEDDGPITGGMARLFKEADSVHAALDNELLPASLGAVLTAQGFEIGSRYRVKVETEGSQWLVSNRVGRDKQFFGVKLVDGRLRITNRGLGKEPLPLDEDLESKAIVTSGNLTDGLARGSVSDSLRCLLAARGMSLPEQVEVAADGPRKWQIKADVDGQPREITLRFEGPNFAAYKLLTTNDKMEADTVWTYDMMGELGVSQHNMCSCSVTALGDILFVNTSNGVDESHLNIPNVKAPSFIALDKNSGKLLWSDDSPGANILHGQWSSPSVGVLAGVPQVIFAGGDGWVYSFRADQGKDGKPELLWKFDANPKESKWVLNGRGTRNNIIATPVLYKELVYVAVGQDPEHGPGAGHLWCIDPSKRGDVSPQLVVSVNDRSQIVPPRRLEALDETRGEVAIDNPNSAAMWHYYGFDRDGDGELSTAETMNRSCGTVAIKDDILYIADFNGIFHCLNAIDGTSHWTYDMYAAAWGSPLIVDGKVFIGDEDGEVAIFKFGDMSGEPIAELDMLNSVYSTPIVANGVMYIANKTHVFAIETSEEAAE